MGTLPYSKFKNSTYKLVAAAQTIAQRKIIPGAIDSNSPYKRPTCTSLFINLKFKNSTYCCDAILLSVTEIQCRTLSNRLKSSGGILDNDDRDECAYWQQHAPKTLSAPKHMPCQNGDQKTNARFGKRQANCCSCHRYSGQLDKATPEWECKS